MRRLIVQDRQPRMIVQERCATGEEPLWNPFDQHMYWTDIPRGRIYRYNQLSGKHELLYEGAVVGGFTIQADGSLLLFMERGRVQCWQDGALTTIVDAIPGEEDTRFNDVIADPRGRVFCGTMPGKTHPARLYRLDLDGSVTLMLDAMGQANGMGFAPDATALYVTDTKAGTITHYRYDEQSGAIAEPIVFARLAGEYPVMDGLAVDAEGRIWSARFGGGCLIGYAPDGREIGSIELPTSRVTSAGFGGMDARDLFITTAGGDETTAAEDPAAGCLFHVQMDVPGRPEFRSRVGL
jgi:D-xylono/L-arabinono-1,4-lactonase